MFLLFLSALAGVLTVLAPCTISLLPVIVGGTLAKESGIRRIVIVTASLGVSVILFTLLLKASTAFISIPQAFWQIFSGVIIVGLGLTMLFPDLWDKLGFVNSLNRSSNKLLATGYRQKNLLGDVLIGAALGPVFSSCSPTYFLIIATVLPQSFAQGLVYLLAYAVGLCGALIIVAFAGQKLLAKFGAASDPKGYLKRAVGVLFLAVGIAIATGFDAKLELAALNSGYLDVAKIERFFISEKGMDALMPMGGAAASTTPQQSAARVASKLRQYPFAPEITNPSGFINTYGNPITLAELRGKVVLIDFWTYSCINCQRTLPYLRAWNEKYASEGLVIIGVHTPEFAFEKVQANVERAVKGFGLTYPIVMDNDYGTWSAFHNQYWPRKYLIDADGFVVYDHAGEGNYDETEAAIQRALAERKQIMGESGDIAGGAVAPADVVEVDNNLLGSPETYFGAGRNEYLGNGRQHATGPQTLLFPAAPQLNRLYLAGTWNFDPEFAQSGAGGKIGYGFMARDVYFVAASKDSATLRILLDGKPIDATSAGKDVQSGSLHVQENRLYHLVHVPQYGQHTLEIQIQTGTLDAYTFTFG
jgi:cytochrome c biogenesis protein CcdA/thiol-disulfide isomerase/thioredoxin